MVRFRFAFGTVVCVWTAAIVSVMIGRWLRLGVGLNVWFSGQDFDWYIILKEGLGLVSSEQEFLIDHRNPLSGWVYSAFSPVILSGPSGLYQLHLLSCLFLGLSVALLTWRLGREKTVVLPACIGSAISIWWIWTTIEQVVWLMLSVYALSALAVFCYCTYVDSGRIKSAHYAWSIVLWLTALGCYTIQSGAILAFVFISLLRQPYIGHKSIKNSILCTCKDVAPHTSIALIYLLIWMTASQGFFDDPSVQRSTHFELNVGSMFLSLQYILWHPSFTKIISNIISFWTWYALSICLFFSVLFSFNMLLILVRIQKDVISICGPMWVLLVSLCIATPTLLLESTSPVWAPGLRSDMLLPAFTPSVALSLLALALGLTRLTTRRQSILLSFGASLLIGLVYIASLEQNRQGQVMTKWMMNLANGIRPLANASAGPLHFIVLNDSKVSYMGGFFANRFAQSVLNRIPFRWLNTSSDVDTTLRIAETSEAPTGFTGSWKVVFDLDAVGVKGALFGSDTAVAYSTVRVVRFDGVRVVPLSRIGTSDLTGYQAELNRKDPATLLTSVASRSGT